MATGKGFYVVYIQSVVSDSQHTSRRDILMGKLFLLKKIIQSCGLGNSSMELPKVQQLKK